MIHTIFVKGWNRNEMTDVAKLLDAATEAAERIHIGKPRDEDSVLDY